MIELFAYIGASLVAVIMLSVVILAIEAAINIYWGWRGARRFVDAVAFAKPSLQHRRGRLGFILRAAFKNWAGDNGNTWWEIGNVRYPVDGRHPVKEWYPA